MKYPLMYHRCTKCFKYSSEPNKVKYFAIGQYVNVRAGMLEQEFKNRQVWGRWSGALFELAWDAGSGQ